MHGVAHDADEIVEWLRALGNPVAYQGESLQSVYRKVLLELLHRKQRTHLSGVEKGELQAEHAFACKHCGATGAMDYDHTIRLTQSHAAPDFQPLCKA